MRNAAWLFVLAIAACGGPNAPAPAGPGSADPAAATCGASPPQLGSGDPAPAAPSPDPRTEIERRRDAACEQLAPKLFACALEDTWNDCRAGHSSREELDSFATSEMQRAHRKDWLAKCETPLTSYQVRVLEVCLREETECGPLVDCLGHLNDRK